MFWWIALVVVVVLAALVWWSSGRHGKGVNDATLQRTRKTDEGRGYGMGGG